MEQAIWRVNVADRTVAIEPVPQNWCYMGGRGLIARILTDEVPPQCDPLGPFNKLIFAPGLLGGLALSSCDRLSVGAKSPLTGGIKEANAGGTTAMRLARLGIKSLIIEGAPSDDGLRVLHLDQTGGRFDPADELQGMGVYAAAEHLIKQYAPGCAIALIGPGGEWRMCSAGISSLDKDNEPSRIAARGGLGAVMGSKGLKAVVIDAAGGEKPALHDRNLFKSAAKHYVKALASHPQTKVYRDYGTPAMTMFCNEVGGLPTRNFSSGRFEGADKISGETMRDLILARRGDGLTTHACMPGCVVKCSSVFAGPDGKKIVSPVEYETIALAGSNLGLADLDVVARLNWEMNDLGIDSIEIGAALGVAAEAGLCAFGDAASVMRLMDEIRGGTSLGRVLGQGAGTAGLVFGIRRVPIAKNQAMSGYDPRAIKGVGVTYATSPQGADHTCGNTVRLSIDHLDPCGQAERSKNAQINSAAYDTLGMCLMAGFGFVERPETMGELLQGRFGWNPADISLQRLGRETLALEHAFNRAAGLATAADRLPEWMSMEPLPPHDCVFDVSEDDLDGVKDL